MGCSAPGDSLPEFGKLPLAKPASSHSLYSYQHPWHFINIRRLSDVIRSALEKSPGQLLTADNSRVNAYLRVVLRRRRM
jgi:hypothetical protein